MNASIILIAPMVSELLSVLSEGCTVKISKGESSITLSGSVEEIVAGYASAPMHLQSKSGQLLVMVAG